jgi:hypothetical protein
LSGGVAKTTTTQTVVIANPINLPITFETAVPAFGNLVVLFLLVQTIQVLEQLMEVLRWPTKPVGAEVWAGSTIELAAPIDFQPKSD